MSQVTSFYDQFSAIQHKSGVHKRHLLIMAWLKYFGLKRNNKVLEIGAGVGTVTGLIAKFLTNGQLVANDISEKSIEIAKRRLQKFSNISFVIGDTTEIRFEEKFDVIVLPDVIEHIPMETHLDLFVHLSHILSEDGFIAVHIPSPYYLEWVKKNRPEELQVIDQPLYMDFLTKNFNEAGFFVSYLNTYAIWNDKPDYQILKLKKNALMNKFDPIPSESSNLLSRVVRKAKSILGIEIYKLPI